jgi:putative tryptophan/tyrosine transport system substrate-binding protein
MTKISGQRSVVRNQRADIMSKDARSAERFLYALFVTVVKPISDLRLLLSGLCAVLLVLCVSAEAQQPKNVPRIGYLSPFTPSASAALLEAFRQGLRELGYVEGRNISIDYRWAEGTPDRFPALAAELISLRVDVIVTQSNQAVAALQQATRTIPIVVVAMGDPVGSGFVASLARPGGNITGFSNLAEELAGKWLELLKEAAPKLSRVAVLAVSQTTAHRTFWAEIQGVAQTLKVTPQRVEIAGPDEIEHALTSLVGGRPQGLIVLPHAVTFDRRTQIVALAAKHHLPGMYSASLYVEAGGLMSYGTSLTDLSRRTATYVDKILKGTKPADLPVEQPVKFELVINLKAAEQIGLTIPPNVLARADKVIR